MAAAEGKPATALPLSEPADREPQDNPAGREVRSGLAAASVRRRVQSVETVPISWEEARENVYAPPEAEGRPAPRGQK